MAKKKTTKKKAAKAVPLRRVADQEEEFSPEMLDSENVRERISISFRQTLLDEIRKVAQSKDIGYQVLIQQVLGSIFLDQESVDLGEKLNARISIQKLQDDLEILKQSIGKKAQ